MECHCLLHGKDTKRSKSIVGFDSTDSRKKLVMKQYFGLDCVLRYDELPS